MKAHETMYFQYHGGQPTRQRKLKDVQNNTRIKAYVDAYDGESSSEDLMKYVERFSYLCDMGSIVDADDSTDCSDSDS